jgi:rRNA maturation RNase YbeY
MISIANRTRSIKVSEKKLRADAQAMLEVLKYGDYDLGILLTTNNSIRTYNREYRHKDKATDILSFPFHPDLIAGERIVIQSDDDKNLGDLIISLEYVAAKAPEWGRTFDEHMTALLAHGISHLLGYDHIIDKDYEAMHKVEKKLLKVVMPDFVLEK